MKWKIDYPYVVCIVFLIGAGTVYVQMNNSRN